MAGVGSAHVGGRMDLVCEITHELSVFSQPYLAFSFRVHYHSLLTVQSVLSNQFPIVCQSF